MLVEVSVIGQNVYQGVCKPFTDFRKRSNNLGRTNRTLQQKANEVAKY